MDQLGAFVPLLLVAAAFYFFILRPARRRQQQATSLSASLRVGQRVMTTAGLFGTLRAVRDDEVDMEIAPGVVVSFVRAAIARVVEPGDVAGPGDAAALAGDVDIRGTDEGGPAHVDDSDTGDNSDSLDDWADEWDDEDEDARDDGSQDSWENGPPPGGPGDSRTG